MAERDANKDALEQVERITESDRDIGEDLLESDDLERVKDGKTAALVSQIQTHFQTLQAAYFAAEQKVTESGRQQFALEQELAQARDAHAKAVASFESERNLRISRRL